MYKVVFLSFGVCAGTVPLIIRLRITGEVAISTQTPLLGLKFAFCDVSLTEVHAFSGRTKN